MQNLGFGLGLRSVHYPRILSGPVRASWFEALTENYLGLEGFPHSEPLQKLLAIRQNFPIVLHGVSLSLASSEALDKQYLLRLKKLKEQIQPAWISDHLCWTGMQGENLHDLLPIPYTEALLKQVTGRVLEIQDFLGMPLLIENISAYLRFSESEMCESEFLRALVRKTDCRLLVDVNNIYVNSVNHGLDPLAYLQNIPRNAVQQIHLAGHSRYGNYLIDTHSAPVCEEVWSLYRESVRLFGCVSTMVEWDQDIPEYDVLEAEMLRAEQEQRAVMEGSHVLAQPAAAL